VEFVPVPPSCEDRGKNKKDRARRTGAAADPPPFLLPKGGAGLELDLSDPRHRDRLPTELRPGLPEQGYVNYLEAQAVVRTVEDLAVHWGELTGAPLPGHDKCRPTVGIVALYPAQVELIRRLIEQCPGLAAPAFDLKVDVPASFRENEYSVVLVSLTRSHAHRAVTYGEGPQALVLALTRARSKLFLFGDPGTLARRTQWQGSLDHLDETASAWERALVTQLVRYLQGQGGRQGAFQVHEARGP
jgi:hypothetical protein